MSIRLRALARAMTLGLAVMSPSVAEAQASNGDPTELSATDRKALATEQTLTAAEPSTETKGEPAFGRRSTWVLSAETQVGAKATVFWGEHSDRNSTLTSVTFAPSLDYFVAENLSLGGSTSFDLQHTSAASAVTVDLGPRIGWNARLSDTVSVWPRFSLTLGLTNVSRQSTEGTTVAHQWHVAAGAYVPILFHPAPHFFAGGGPLVSTQFLKMADYVSDRGKATTLGALFTLGGWW